MDAPTEHGIVLTNTPDAVLRPMAVAALTLVFALAGRLLVKDRLVREDRWAERTAHRGLGLTTRTLGVVGAGGIGRELLGLARPFFGRRVAADSYADTGAVRALGAELLGLNELLPEADFVVVSCPLNEDTFHLFDAARLRRMRPSAYLIDIARGPVVDEAALVAALQANAIAGAGLDVFEGEPIRPGTLLARMDDVVLTPHALGWTDECFHGIAATGFRGIVAFGPGPAPGFRGQPDRPRPGAGHRRARPGRTDARRGLAHRGTRRHPRAAWRKERRRATASGWG